MKRSSCEDFAHEDCFFSYIFPSRKQNSIEFFQNYESNDTNKFVEHYFQIRVKHRPQKEGQGRG
jgi:hypothetical protein